MPCDENLTFQFINKQEEHQAVVTELASIHWQPLVTQGSFMLSYVAIQSLNFQFSLLFIFCSGLGERRSHLASCANPQRNDKLPLVKGPKVPPRLLTQRFGYLPDKELSICHESNTILLRNPHPLELTCLFLGILLPFIETTHHHPPNLGKHGYSFLVFLKTFWHVIMLMKLLMTGPDVWGLWIVHLLANVIKG